MLMMTVNDLARELRVSSRHIWGLVAAGRFPQPQRLGRSARWPRKVIEAFVEAGMDMATFEAEQAGISGARDD